MSKKAEILLLRRAATCADEAYQLSLNITDDDLKKQYETASKIGAMRSRISETNDIIIALEELQRGR